MTRADGNEFADLVWQALDARGLIPSDTAYQGVRDAVTRSGEQAWAAVLGIVGRDQWDAANATLRRPWVSDDPQRILGFGWWMTRFLIAPLRPPAPADAAVADAGALANLIVALYDQFVDSGRLGPAILSPTTLESGLHAWPGPDTPAVGPPDPPKDVLDDLVLRYFELVAAIPRGQLSGVVDSLLPGAIRRMYDAENRLIEVGKGATDRTSEGRLGCSHALLRRKAALPFVVMGLPGWSASRPRSSIAAAWHLRWMYRVGTFLGWIDDAVDLDDDAAARAPNRVRCALVAHPAGAAGLAALIASSGVRCLDDWRRYTGDEPQTDVVTAVLGAAVYSWFGATRSHA